MSIFNKATFLNFGKRKYYELTENYINTHKFDVISFYECYGENE